MKTTVHEQNGTRELVGACHCGRCSWHSTGVPERALSCNCTVCRRFGALWVYGYETDDVFLHGNTLTYQPGESLGFHCCAYCHGLMFWRALLPNDQGLYRVGLNLRMAEPEAVNAIPLDRFDGLNHWQRETCVGRFVADVL